MIAQIVAEVSSIVKTPELRERLIGLGVDPAGTTPAEFKALFASETEKWAKVVKVARISLD